LEKDKLKKSVLILGSGGREHAFAWSLAKDKNVTKVYCAPGNGGTAQVAENIALNLSNHQEVVRVVKEKNIDLTVVGPENPLAKGIVDIFITEGLRIFGPDAYGAQLESSKLFARDLMAKNNIPHPDYYSCSTRDEAESLKVILKLPLVLKADGLAAGKGVIICENDEEFEKGLRIMFDSSIFGDATSRISLERCLVGEELSVFAVCDGKDYRILSSAQDHKRAYDKDKGPNTGGMGAYSPTQLLTPVLLDRVGLEIIQPTLTVMAERGHPYRGFLYVGLMIVDGKPYVIEFNVRMGDPEAQVILPLIESSFFELLWHATEGTLNKANVKISAETAVTVVMAVDGYPDTYKKGMRIKGLDKLQNRLIFHAGTRKDSHDTLTTGGRVLNAVGFGKDLPAAISDVYDIVKRVDFDDKFYRRDIGQRGLKYLKKGV
jgi:phosphoribosylamine--glycine ligase